MKPQELNNEELKNTNGGGGCMIYPAVDPYYGVTTNVDAEFTALGDQDTRTDVRADVTFATK